MLKNYEYSAYEEEEAEYQQLKEKQKEPEQEQEEISQKEITTFEEVIKFLETDIKFQEYIKNEKDEEHYRECSEDEKIKYFCELIDNIYNPLIAGTCIYQYKDILINFSIFRSIYGDIKSIEDIRLLDKKEVIRAIEDTIEELNDTKKELEE